MNKLEGVETTIQKNVQTRWSNDDTGRYFGSMMTLRHRAKITKEENVTIREDGGKMLICGNVGKKNPERCMRSARLCGASERAATLHLRCQRRAV